MKTLFLCVCMIIEEKIKKKIGGVFFLALKSETTGNSGLDHSEQCWFHFLLFPE